MDFRLNADQERLTSGVREYLEGEYGPPVLRRLDAERARDPAIWNGLVEMGLTGILVPEEQGGLGLGLTEAVLVAIELGRANVSEPLADTALVAVPLLGDDLRGLERIAAGEMTVALSHAVNPWILDLDAAERVLGATVADDRPADLTPLESIDPLRRLFGRLGSGGGREMLDLAALMTAGQLFGGAERMLQLATDYARERKQFGQPIGGFQAVQHQLATVAMKIEFARPVLLRAAYAAQHAHARASVHISHAKVAATDAAVMALEAAIQVHGAMGYTYEVDLHYWMKRAWALAGAWGDRAFHERRVANAVIGGTMALGPDRTFASAGRANEGLSRG